MGWSTGPQLAGEIWDLVRPHVTVNRRAVAKEFIQIFCSYDADDWCEQQRLLEDAGHPGYEDDEAIDKFWAEPRN
jgi:hypothetical protein